MLISEKKMQIKEHIQIALIKFQVYQPEGTIDSQYSIIQ